MDTHPRHAVHTNPKQWGLLVAGSGDTETMKRIFFALLALVALPCSSFGQAMPQLSRPVTHDGPVDLNRALSTKADATKGKLTSPSIRNGALSSPSLSAPTITNGTLSGSIISAARLSSPNITMAGDQSLTVKPIGNDIASLSSLSLTSTAVSPGTREFMVNLGMSSAVGGSVAQTDKVVIYAGMSCEAGSGNCWSMNPLVSAQAGYNGNAQTIEADLDNFSGDMPESAGLRAAVTANGRNSDPSFLNTTGFLVGSIHQTPIWHDGILISNNSVKDAGIVDETSGATYGYENVGMHTMNFIHDTGKAVTGVDLSGTYSYAAIATTNAKTGTALEVADNQAICFNGSQFCVKTSAGTIKIYAAGTVIASVDGSGNARFAGTVTGNTSP